MNEIAKVANSAMADDKCDACGIAKQGYLMHACKANLKFKGRDHIVVCSDECADKFAVDGWCACGCGG